MMKKILKLKKNKPKTVKINLYKIKDLKILINLEKTEKNLTLKNSVKEVNTLKKMLKINIEENLNLKN